jgi:hypothetical protein
MYMFIECAKLGLFVLALLTTIIFFMEGCMSTNVRILHDEIPCVMTETHFGVWQGNSIYERQQIDCSEWGEEDWNPNVRTPKTEADNDPK